MRVATPWHHPEKMNIPYRLIRSTTPVRGQNGRAARDVHAKNKPIYGGCRPLHEGLLWADCGVKIEAVF